MASLVKPTHRVSTKGPSMAMSDSERADLLSQWIKPSSDDEKTQQDRAVRMVTEAIENCSSLESAQTLVYAKGSYPNNTNVRRDSDVDIVVECQDCFHYKYDSNVPTPTSGVTPYVGPWDPDSVFRTAVEDALKDKFGASSIDTSGEIAIAVAAVPGSRPSIDVVPSYQYRLFSDSTSTTYRQGTSVMPRSGGERIVNWPAQQLKNGQSKNVATGQRYKNYVRALKNAENTLATAGTIDALPSYFMECLVWNVPNDLLQKGDLSDGFRATLTRLHNGLKDDGNYGDWTEPNDIKYLFRSSQKWTRQQAQELVLATWHYLGY